VWTASSFVTGPPVGQSPASIPTPHRTISVPGRSRPGAERMLFAVPPACS
jgi:hypothetical protein